ncbi:MAG: 3-phosphoshikimate 1-carboxyvinyltransferase [Eubacteriales bacterium]|nr:3-phosphoshikimate 1-carboxyvinyltransferase [Eubacteriales bacterium]
MKINSSKSSLKGKIIVPGSKSHTIRAVLLAAMAEGKSIIRNPLTSEDCKSAAQAARLFGADVQEAEGVWYIQGAGKNLKVPADIVDCGNSGTTTIFVMGMAALLSGYAVITGDEQIRRRPVHWLTQALKDLGATAIITRPDQQAPPVLVGGPLQGGTAVFDGFNSQVVSATMLASAICGHKVEIQVDHPLEKPYLQMTIDWMKKFGVDFVEKSEDYAHFVLDGQGVYQAIDAVVPSDWSGVAFPLVASVITDSDVVIEGLDFHDAQGDKAVVDHLLRMGAQIKKDEAQGQLHILGGTPLKSGLEINLNDTPDALPALAVAAAYAEGETTFTGLAHVRVKETDRVAVMEEQLARLGVKTHTTPDSMVVFGGQGLKGQVVASEKDHRIAMALAVAGLAAEGVVTVEDAESADVSFPGFYQQMQNLGANFQAI